MEVEMGPGCVCRKISLYGEVAVFQCPGTDPALHEYWAVKSSLFPIATSSTCCERILLSEAGLFLLVDPEHGDIQCTLCPARLCHESSDGEMGSGASRGRL